MTNLREYLPELTLEELKKALRESFEEVYNLKSEEKKMQDLDADEVEEKKAHFHPGNGCMEENWTSSTS